MRDDIDLLTALYQLIKSIHLPVQIQEDSAVCTGSCQLAEHPRPLVLGHLPDVRRIPHRKQIIERSEFAQHCIQLINQTASPAPVKIHQIAERPHTLPFFGKKLIHTWTGLQVQIQARKSFRQNPSIYHGKNHLLPRIRHGAYPRSNTGRLCDDLRLRRGFLCSVAVHDFSDHTALALIFVNLPAIRGFRESLLRKAGAVLCQNHHRPDIHLTYLIIGRPF